MPMGSAKQVGLQGQGAKSRACKYKETEQGMWALEGFGEVRGLQWEGAGVR